VGAKRAKKRARIRERPFKENSWKHAGVELVNGLVIAKEPFGKEGKTTGFMNDGSRSRGTCTAKGKAKVNLKSRGRRLPERRGQDTFGDHAQHAVMEGERRGCRSNGCVRGSAERDKSDCNAFPASAQRRGEVDQGRPIKSSEKSVVRDAKKRNPFPALPCQRCCERAQKQSLLPARGSVAKDLGQSSATT